MKKNMLLFFMFFQFVTYGQIDYTKLIIGRNTGTKTFYDGSTARIFGFAETLGESIDIPGPTIYVEENDSVKIDFWNVSQGAPHTIHLHGLDVDQENDGVPMLSFEVNHMEHGYYHFKAPHPGTYLYHCHVASAIHVQAGMYGVIIVRPASGDPLLNWTGGESYDQEFIWTTSEVDTVWHNDLYLNHEHDSLNPMAPMPIPATYEPQYYLVNGLSDSQLTDLSGHFWALQNAKVYARMSNVGFYGVRYIFPSAVSARTVANDGRPLGNEILSDSMEIYPGERYETFLQLGSDPTYTVSVEYFNLNTQEVASVQSVIIHTSSVGLEEAKIDLLSVYPNPSVDGVFFADLKFEEDYMITDLSGRILLQGNAPTIDLSKQSSGVYFLNYRNQTIRLLRP